jgi:hypothetical protein
MMTSKHKSSDAGNFIIPYRYNSSILLLLLLIPTVPNLQMKLYQRDAMYRKKQYTEGSLLPTAQHPLWSWDASHLEKGGIVYLSPTSWNQFKYFLK